VKKSPLSDSRPDIFFLDGAGKTALFKSILDDGCRLRIQVTGSSMAPFIKSGDVVTVQKFPFEDLKIGDLVLCRHQGYAMKLHRLIRIRKNPGRFYQNMMLTKGDANREYDPVVDKNAYMGKVIFLHQYQGDTIIEKNMQSRLAVFKNFLLAVYFRLKMKVISILNQPQMHANERG